MEERRSSSIQNPAWIIDLKLPTLLEYRSETILRTQYGSDGLYKIVFRGFASVRDYGFGKVRVSQVARLQSRDAGTGSTDGMWWRCGVGTWRLWRDKRQANFFPSVAGVAGARMLQPMVDWGFNESEESMAMVGHEIGNLARTVINILCHQVSKRRNMFYSSCPASHEMSSPLPTLWGQSEYELHQHEDETAEDNMPDAPAAISATV
ncbi:hypothetical protein EX30DRAFT_351768 [Ascodesmis nigricans]|uniref:Uncharacterized protein n=1 Tax=Ascodesmis nigricans TaxID=341454 RepID=A0A4S2MKN8_9PEZI|nr:hypothetical protein EX30DRAFT_351768 [Ascodesmis nigricans]